MLRNHKNKSKKHKKQHKIQNKIIKNKIKKHLDYFEHISLYDKIILIKFICIQIKYYKLMYLKI